MPKRITVKTGRWLLSDLEALKRIERFETLYRSEDNPLFAWTAYRLARDAGLEVPAWVLEYFDMAALNLEWMAGQKPKAGRIHAAIVKAMGTGFAHGMWIRDTGVVSNAWGKPEIIWSERGRRMCAQLGIGEGHVSLTDEAGLIVAVAVLLRK